MSKITFHRLTAVLCAVLLQSLCIVVIAQGSVVDTQAPKIIHTPSEQPTANNQKLIIVATVTDDGVVDEVTLFHRLEGEQKYSQMKMNRAGVKDLYTAQIPLENAEASGVEYYIQASDRAGNSGLYGLSFSPVLVELGSSALLQGESPSNPPQAKKSKTKWLWIGLGVVAAAVVAGSAGGGGDSGGNDTGDVDVVAPVP